MLPFYTCAPHRTTSSYFSGSSFFTPPFIPSAALVHSHTPATAPFKKDHCSYLQLLRSLTISIIIGYLFILLSIYQRNIFLFFLWFQPHNLHTVAVLITLVIYRISCIAHPTSRFFRCVIPHLWTAQFDWLPDCAHVYNCQSVPRNHTVLYMQIQYLIFHTLCPPMCKISSRLETAANIRPVRYSNCTIIQNWDGSDVLWPTRCTSLLMHFGFGSRNAEPSPEPGRYINWRTLHEKRGRTFIVPMPCPLVVSSINSRMSFVTLFLSYQRADF